ncbi:MAG TPA: hypothetical protein VMH40_07500 [Myxococcaceae bacterium]|nr:hypothetical protein [Myxococcaceae bacterium]
MRTVLPAALCALALATSAVADPRPSPEEHGSAATPSTAEPQAEPGTSAPSQPGPATREDLERRILALEAALARMHEQDLERELVLSPGYGVWVQ